MKQHLAGFLAVLTVLVLCLSCLTGCGSTVGKDDDDITAVVVDGDKYSLSEAKLYVYTSQYMVEMSMEFMISYMFSDYESFWNEDNNGATYYQMNYLEGISKMIQTKRLLKEAAARKITLDDEELAKVDAAFASFKADRPNVLEASGCSDELLKTYLTENALAVKTYMAMVEDVDTNFDQDEFRRKKVEAISVSALKEKPAAEAEEGEETEDTEETEEAETVTYTEEEQTKAREEAVAAIQERMLAGEALSDIKADYDGSETVSVYSVGDITLSPDDAPEEGEAATSYREAGWGLSTGEVDVFDTDGADSAVVSYVIRCVNDDDPDLRKEAEDTELASRKSELFSERYAELIKKYPKYHVYEDLILSIKKVIPMYESEIVSPSAEAEAE